MQKSKFLLIFLGLVAIGFLVLPSTVSLFAGQHYWYSLSGGEDFTEIFTEIPCEKCHADVAAEMDQIAGPHTGETGADRLECEYCHRVRYGDYQYATEVGTVTPGEKAHAASTVACMDCHKTISDEEFNNVVGGDHWDYYPTCDECHGPGTVFNEIPYAGGFGLTNASGDTGSMAAHMKFILDSIDNTDMLDSNEACIACHTGIAVRINWSHARSLEFNVGLEDTVTTDTGVHNWTFTQWSLNGTANATSWGNTTGYGQAQSWSEWPGNIGDIYE